MEPIITELFLAVLPELLTYAGERALNLLNTRVGTAIRATARDFPKYPQLADWLSDWCSSEEFFHLQSSIGEGDRINPLEITGSFAKFVSTINPDLADRCANEVLPKFFRRVNEQVLGSPGLAIIEQRTETRHQEVLAETEKIRSEVSILQTLIDRKRLSNPSVHAAELVLNSKGGRTTSAGGRCPAAPESCGSRAVGGGVRSQRAEPG